MSWAMMRQAPRIPDCLSPGQEATFYRSLSFAQRAELLGRGLPRGSGSAAGTP